MSEHIPEGWQTKTVRQFCEILDSQRIPLNSNERQKRQGRYPYYGANGIQDFIDDYIFDGDSILLAEDGGNFDQYQTRSIAQWVTGKFWVNNHAHILRAKDCQSNKWVYYCLVHANILKFINGGTRAKLNQADLREIELLIAPLPEQKKIASTLTSVDEVIENTQKQIDKLQDLKKATMNELLTKGIGHTEFKDSELGIIPSSWVISRFDKFITLQRGHDLPVQNRCNGTIPIYGSNGVVGYHNYTNTKQTGVITGRSGSIGEVYFVSGKYWALNTTLYVKNFHGNDKEFVAYFLQNYQLYRFATGTGVPTLNRNDIHSQLIGLPPLNEQVLICKILNSLDTNIEKFLTKFNQLQSLKKSLMQSLLTGRTRLTTD